MQGEKDGRVARRQGGRFPVLFKDGGRRVRPRFHLFVSDANNKMKEFDVFKIFLRDRRDGKILLGSNTSC